MMIHGHGSPAHATVIFHQLYEFRPVEVICIIVGNPSKHVEPLIEFRLYTFVDPQPEASMSGNNSFVSSPFTVNWSTTSPFNAEAPYVLEVYHVHVHCILPAHPLGEGGGGGV
jgi:hypothetical protein